MSGPSNLKVKRLIELDALPTEDIDVSWMYATANNKDYKVNTAEYIAEASEVALNVIREELLDPDTGFGADMVAYEQAGAGAVPRTVTSKLSDMLSVKDYSTETEAVARAVATGSSLEWPAGTYAISGNIPGFHDVTHTGSGVITRGSETWAIDPRNEDTRRIYVSASGDDSNDGLTSDFPIATGLQASEILRNLGPEISGNIEIILAAGTYAGFVLGRKFGNTSLITVKGPDVTLNTEPTAIIDQTLNSARAAGVSVAGTQRVTLQNIKTQGFSTTGRAGVSLAKQCDVSLINVWDDGSYYGWDIQDGVSYRVLGGNLENNNTGVNELFGCRRAFYASGPSEATTISTSTDVGFRAKESGVGHLDYLNVNGAGNACVEFQSGGTANVVGMVLNNATVGFLIANCELHNMSSVTFGSGIVHAVKRIGSGYELTALGWTGSPIAIETGFSPLTLIGTPKYVQTAQTGTTPVDYALGTLLAKRYNAKGQRAKVVVRGAVRGGALAAPCLINIVIGGALLGGTVNVPTATIQNAGFTLEMELITTSNGNVQLVCCELRGEGTTFIDVQHVERTIDYTTDKAVALRVTPGNAGDGVQILSAELWG